MAGELDKSQGKPPAQSSQAEVDAFLRKVAALPQAQGSTRGRLIFAMDATASREPSWDTACRIQGEMFETTSALGGLDVQLVFYRGYNECKASRWLSAGADLHRAMRAVSCAGGETQIGRVLEHAVKMTKAAKVNALVFVGDAMEENLDSLCQTAGELALLGVPAFLFQEGQNPTATKAFREVARITRGAHCTFDAGSAKHLKELLGAVAVYAAGGLWALRDHGQRVGGGAALLLSHLA